MENEKTAELTRQVLEWAYSADSAPPEIHDAAAMLLDQPSLCCGFVNDLISENEDNTNHRRKSF